MSKVKTGINLTMKEIGEEEIGDKEIGAKEWDNMSWEDKHLYLRICFEHRETSQDALYKASKFSYFGITLISFISEYDFKNITRESADIIIGALNYFRYHVQTRVISDFETSSIRAVLIKLLFTSHSTIIRNYMIDNLLEFAIDFPVRWPSLLSDLSKALEDSRKDHGYYAVNGLLAMIDALSIQFRSEFSTHKKLVDFFSEQVE